MLQLLFWMTGTLGSLIEADDPNDPPMDPPDARGTPIIWG